MSAPAGPLYTPGILALAVDLADYPLTDDLLLRGQASSRLCGSAVALGVACDEAGRILRAGGQVTACAIGQASAALFLRDATGRDETDLAASLAALEHWLAGGDEPAWPGVDVLTPARAYPARHGAILLPWQAALAALSKLGAGG